MPFTNKHFNAVHLSNTIINNDRYFYIGLTMKKLLIILTMLAIVPIAFSQARKTYIVKAGEKIIEALPVEARFLYPQFTIGTVNFKNNNVGTNLLNYNRLLDEIQFIDNKGDTLSLSEEPTVASIYIAKDTFYFYQGYVRMIATIKNVKFGEKNVMVLSNRQKIGGLGELSSASIDTHVTLSTSQGMRDLVQKEQLTFAPYNTFYIGDKFNRFKVLNKKNLMNMYDKQEHEILAFLNEQSINLLKAEDVRKLIDFLKTL